MRNLPVYKQEIADGVSEKLLAKAAVAWCSPIVPEESFEIPEHVLAAARKNNHFSLAENKDQMDLYYFRSILVTTGFNLNDDVFDVKETWAARYTPEDKPFNYEHDCTDIIGHHTANYVIDDSSSMNVVPANTPIDGLPERFHIVTRVVMYKLYDHEERQERADKIIAEIRENLWFVSMEAWYNDFDYALLNEKTGESKIVARNEKTAFLTKHLRAYGGEGTYQNYRVGRLLRNITFGGSGLVRNPANPNSIIFKDNASTKLFSSKSTLVYEIPSEKNNGSKIIMSTEAKDINLDSLVAKLTEQASTIAELQKQVAQNDSKVVAAKVDELTQSVATLTEKNKELTTKVETVTAEKTAIATQLTELTTKHTEVVAAFDAVKAENRKNQRVALVVEAYGVDKAKAEKIVESLTVLSDEAFASHVETHKDLVKKVEVTEAKVEKTEKKEKVEETLETVETKETFDGIVATVDSDEKLAAVFADIRSFMHGSNETEGK